MNTETNPDFSKAEVMTGAEIVVRALVDQGVTTLFGYPGGAVLPIYDALHAHEEKYGHQGLQHILVRHEQGAAHAAEGYARASGKVGVVLVTSGPGATNTITGIVDALMDSIPIVVITGQAPTHLIGTDAFQECDTVGITRSATKHNVLVKDIAQLAETLHEAFQIAASGRPGPVLVDIPKDIQFAKGPYYPPNKQGLYKHRYQPRTKGDAHLIEEAADLIVNAVRPIFYTGGGIINSGSKAVTALKGLADLTKAPVTSTLMGLGAFPAHHPQWLGMLGMHGSYEANQAMHDCDVMICIGARFDDRVTGRVDAFSPASKKIHIDIDPSSIGKIIRPDVGIIGDAGQVSQALLDRLQQILAGRDQKARLSDWWKTIAHWRARKCFSYKPSDTLIKPQYAIERLWAAVKDRDPIITTEVGLHQMWAAQFMGFEHPNRWLTSGGLGTMGYGFPAAIGAQLAFPKSLVIDVAGDASIQMNIQEMSTAIQYDLPVKIFILNNEWMGMVRQWQELLHGERYSHSYSSALPDFVKLAEAYGAVGLRAETPQELDGKIAEMLSIDRLVLFDCRVIKTENCFPMIPSGKAHNEMIFPDHEGDLSKIIDSAGQKLV